MTACTSNVKNQEMSINVNSTTVNGDYTGPTENKKADGNGEFVSSDSAVISGSFSDGEIINGTVKDYPYTLAFEENNYTGTYSGDIKNSKLNGEGKFISDGASFDGKFEDGEITSGVLKIGDIEYNGTFKNDTLEEGSVKNLPLTYNYNDTDFDGTYTGDYKSGMPDEDGSFTMQDNANPFLMYDGSWSNGKFSGKGELKTDKCTINRSDGSQNNGTYDGDVLDGEPDGEGVFSGAETDGTSYTYTGSWKNGLFNGQGTRKYDDERYAIFSGNYSQGEFDPTNTEWFAYNGTVKNDAEYTISDANKKFISDHDDLWQNMNISAVNAMSPQPFNYLDYAKNQDSISATLVSSTNLNVVQIQESSDPVFVRIIAADSNYEHYYNFFARYTVPDLVEGDVMNAYFLPLGYSTFVNTMQVDCWAVSGALAGYEKV